MSEMWINMGPQHPMTHGLWNLRIHVDGEIVLGVDPEMGFLHRGIEKISEDRHYNEVITRMDRCCYVAGMAWEHLYIRAAEQALHVEPPERAQWIRVLAEEMQRIASHVMWYAAFVQDIGLMSPFLYGMRDRDLLLDLFQSFTGGRLTYEYMRVGGVRNDLPPTFPKDCRKVLDWLMDRFKGYDDLCLGSDIFHRRCDGLGVLKASDCIAHGVTGPMLRGAGVRRDLRKDRPYAVYDQVEFDVAYADTADVTSRYIVRMEEVRQSVRICRQALDWLDRHPGPVMAAHLPRWLGAPYAPVGREGYLLKRNYPKGLGFSAIEEPHGEAAAYVVNEGGEHPYRVKFRSPVFGNISAANQYLTGCRIADIPPIMGSVDVCVGEVDRVARSDRSMAVQSLYGVANLIAAWLLGALGSVSPTGVAQVIDGSPAIALLSAIIFGAILLGASMINTIMLIWWERKLLGRFMDRRGAMHVGYAGLLQNFADGFKLFRKHTFKPRDADALGYYTGPVAYLVTSLIIFGVLPISTGWDNGSLPLSLLLALVIFSFAPLFIFVSAWSSNNKYSLIGGMRSAAQMIAYEVPILLAVVAVVIVSGSFDLTTIVQEQQNYWYWGPLFLALIVFVVGMLAEMERIPFDLPEAEAELVEGWNTEYGGMLFAFFMVTDYFRALIGSILVVLLFLGGWTLPTYVPSALTSFPLAGIFWFMLKTYIVFAVFVWIRASLPEVRTDQLLRVGWMRMIPLSLCAVVLAAALVSFHNGCLPVFGCAPSVGG